MVFVLLQITHGSELGSTDYAKTGFDEDGSIDGVSDSTLLGGKLGSVYDTVGGLQR